MTDKPIMIDGVAVSKCECSSQIDLDENIICISNFPSKNSGYCKDNPNCYFKQLKRTEQKLIRIGEIAEYEFKELMNAEDYHNMTEILQQILQIIEEEI